MWATAQTSFLALELVLPFGDVADLEWRTISFSTTDITERMHPRQCPGSGEDFEDVQQARLKQQWGGLVDEIFIIVADSKGEYLQRMIGQGLTDTKDQPWRTNGVYAHT